MKGMKRYEKPRITIEQFEMNHSIANCSPAMNHSKLSCEFESDELYGLINDGETVFNEVRCTYTETQFISIFEGFCLQTSTDGQNLFTS